MRSLRAGRCPGATLKGWNEPKALMGCLQRPRSISSFRPRATWVGDLCAYCLLPHHASASLWILWCRGVPPPAEQTAAATAWRSRPPSLPLQYTALSCAAARGCGFVVCVLRWCASLGFVSCVSCGPAFMHAQYFTTEPPMLRGLPAVYELSTMPLCLQNFPLCMSTPPPAPCGALRFFSVSAAVFVACSLWPFSASIVPALESRRMW